MNKKLSKVGLIFLSAINFIYALFLVRGTRPNPVTDSIVSENTRFVIIAPIILMALCVAGLFIKEKNIGMYRKCTFIFTALRVITGEFGAFWFTFYVVWQESGVTNPFTIFADLDKPSLFLCLGVILLILALPLIAHISALMCFEYGLEKEKRMKNLRIYKILLISLLIIALIGISAMLIVYFKMI